MQALLLYELSYEQDDEELELANRELGSNRKYNRRG
jgi:hypothetical protein